MASLKLLRKTFALDLTTSATATGLQLVPNSPTRAFMVAVVLAFNIKINDERFIIVLQYFKIIVKNQFV